MSPPKWLSNSQWSSYRATAGLEEPPAFLTTHWLLGQFAQDRKRAQRLAARPSLEEIFRGSPEVEGIALAYREYRCGLREIAEHLGVHHATVSRRLRKFERAQGPNPAV